MFFTFLFWIRLANFSAARASGTCNMVFSSADTASAATMEPLFENMLLDLKIHADVIWLNLLLKLHTVVCFWRLTPQRVCQHQRKKPWTSTKM